MEKNQINKQLNTEEQRQERRLLAGEIPDLEKFKIGCSYTRVYFLPSGQLIWNLFGIFGILMRGFAWASHS